MTKKIKLELPEWGFSVVSNDQEVVRNLIKSMKEVDPDVIIKTAKMTN